MKALRNIPISAFNYWKLILLHQLLFNLLLLPINTLAVPYSSLLSTLNIFERINRVSLSTVDIIKNNGYPVEIHRVYTEDGYILEMHRIPKGKSGKRPTKNYPVLFHHTFVTTSAIWVLSGANTSLPMQLADLGYDVWLANCRGNTYSRNHIKLKPTKREFWDFSLHEIGKYDLPAEIDHILKKSNASQLHYIGYSMGTSVFYIMASERPEYQSKIRSQISLAPIAYLSNIESPVKYILPIARTFHSINRIISNGMILPESLAERLFAATVCGGFVQFVQRAICNDPIFTTYGVDPYDFNTALVPFILGHMPAGTSSTVIAHLSQIRSKDEFGPYDYSSIKNLKLYNSTKPPAYNLKSIQVPITLMYGKNDLISDQKDVTRLKAQLPKIMDTVLIYSPTFNHFDFLWSKNVNEQVNEPVIDVLNATDSADWKYSGSILKAGLPRNRLQRSLIEKQRSVRTSLD